MNTPHNSNSPLEEQPRALFELLFGAKVTESSVSEGALVKALDLKVEQERTKQQYYRLENINRSIELFKLARDLGVPPQDISKLFNPDASVGTTSSTVNAINNASNVIRENNPTENVLKIGSSDLSHSESLSRQPLSYRFPPAGSNLPPKPVSINGGNLSSFRRTNSPARIGAHAVAALNDSVVLKEEEMSPSASPFMTRNINGSNYNSHSRNLSLPIARYSSPSIPSGMTSILSFNKETAEPMSHPYSHNHTTTLRRSAMVRKKHGRSRSASSFGVIDLNVIDDAKRQDLQRLKSPESSTGPAKHHEYDEKTCSESSSRNESPVRNNGKSINPVEKLLNSS